MHTYIPDNIQTFSFKKQRLAPFRNIIVDAGSSNCLKWGHMIILNKNYIIILLFRSI